LCLCTAKKIRMEVRERPKVIVFWRENDTGGKKLKRGRSIERRSGLKERAEEYSTEKKKKTQRKRHRHHLF
jgi:hypothetical protein